MKIIKFIKDYIFSLIENKIATGISGSFLWGSVGGIICMYIRWGTELMWWEKILLSFIFTFVITFIINMNRVKDNKDKMNKEDKTEIINNKNINNMKNRMEKFMGMIIFKWIRKLIGYILIMIGMGSINNIYCDGTDDGIEVGGVAKELVKNVSKRTEEANSSSVSSVSNNKTSSGDSGKDGLIPSILESGDELSPLQMILNYEIILGICVLLHMCLLILIWLHKLYVSSVWSIISKLLSKETVTKYEKFKKMMEKIGQSYLIILIIINVVFILFDLGIIIYANIELSNNIDDFIHVHLNMKNSIIMLLFVKSKFNINKNKIEKNKQR